MKVRASVKRICENCKEEYEPSESQLMELNLRPEDVAGRVFYFGRGCDYCNNTGYKGRLALFEMMVMDDELRELINDNASTAQIRDAARKWGMRTLREAGLASIYNGISSIEEVVRETLGEAE